MWKRVVNINKVWTKGKPPSLQTFHNIMMQEDSKKIEKKEVGGRHVSVLFWIRDPGYRERSTRIFLRNSTDFLSVNQNFSRKNHFFGGANGFGFGVKMSQAVILVSSGMMSRWRRLLLTERSQAVEAGVV